MITAIDHVQISIPEGRVDDAVDFYVEVLGFERIPKPPELSQSGAWLTAGKVNLHLAERDPFVTDGHAHPAFCVDDLDELMMMAEKHDAPVRMDEGPNGYKRGSVFDPFGNRIELMQRLT